MEAPIDRHAPLKTKTVTVRPQVPWYSQEIREAKRARRRAERKWRTTRSVVDLVSFKRHKNHVTHLLKEVKSAFLTDFISQNSDNQGKLFRAVKNLLVETKSLCFLDYTDKTTLANDIVLCAKNQPILTTVISQMIRVMSWMTVMLIVTL